MHIALFIIYGVLGGWGILKLPFLRRTGLRPGMLLLLLTIHVAVGCLHNWIAWRYYPGHGDVWDSFQWGILLREWLHGNVRQFLLANSTWTYFTHNGVNFIQLLLNFLSADNLYVNTLLFSFPVFLGNAALYQVFRRHFPADPLAALTAFLLPSTLFWTSCLFRESALYMLLGFFFYQLDLLSVTAAGNARDAGRRIPALTKACCLFLLLLYFRFAVALLLLPALLVKRWVERPFRRSGRIAIVIVAVLTILVFFIPRVQTAILHGIAGWQAQFQTLEGHSRLPLPAMDGSWSGIVRTAPYAFVNGLFQPLPGAGGRPIYFAFAIELIIIWAIVALALARTLIRSTRAHSPVASGHSLVSQVPPPAASTPFPVRSGFAAACIVFALTGMLAVGALVPFAGAIVRYRSIYLPFLLAPALHSLRDFPGFRSANNWVRNRL